MRQLQKQSKQRQEQKTQPVKALWQSEKYKDVTSKVANLIVVSTSCFYCLDF